MKFRIDLSNRTPVTFGLACLGFRWSVRRSPVLLRDLHKFSLRSSLLSSLSSYLSPFIISSLLSQTEDFLSNSSLRTIHTRPFRSQGTRRFKLAPPMLRSIGSTYFATEEDTQTLRIDQLTRNNVAVFAIGFIATVLRASISDSSQNDFDLDGARFSYDLAETRGSSSLSRSREEYASETGAFRQRRVVCSALRNH